MRMAPPERRSGEDGAVLGFGLADGTAEARDEPRQPLGDVQCPSLRRLQRPVITRSLPPDLRRYAIESPARSFHLRQSQIGDGAGDPAVAVIERVDGDEPQVRDGAAQQAVDRGTAVEP